MQDNCYSGKNEAVHGSNPIVAVPRTQSPNAFHIWQLRFPNQIELRSIASGPVKWSSASLNIAFALLFREPTTTRFIEEWPFKPYMCAWVISVLNVELTKSGELFSIYPCDAHIFILCNL